MLTHRFQTAFPALRPGGPMDRLFSDLFGDGLDSLAPWGGLRTFPALNVWEDEEKVSVEAEVPGLKMKELEVTVTGNELTIRGNREVEEKDQGLDWHRQERTRGSFVRTVTLPVDIDADRVEAGLKDGVLTVTLGKASAARARKIKIQS